ncbi:MAG: hypothetical protein EAZ55_11200 [Cytophagales bacterium]|nr:MAG: hypothetical protein EAZ55_11200 [Cytophagales bacterium]
MPKFKALKDGVNDALLASTRQKIEAYMKEIFHDHEIVQVEGVYSFVFGTITVNIEVLPWHSEDVIVKVYSYLGENVLIDTATSEQLLHLNTNIPLGCFGVTFEKQAIFSYSLTGANIDRSEFEASVQIVAKVADEYDEVIKQKQLANA